MAVDTRTKRASAMNFGGPYSVTLPDPDGTVWDGDRAHLLGLYSSAASSMPGAGANEPVQGLRPAVQVVSAFRI